MNEEVNDCQSLAAAELESALVDDQYSAIHALTGLEKVMDDLQADRHEPNYLANALADILNPHPGADMGRTRP